MEDLELAIAAAQAGAAVVRRHFGERPAADLKGTNDPVTQVDLDSEAAIVALIESERPADTIVAEEGAGVARDGDRRWYIDPLDGTVNFVHAIPQVSVSVALYEGGTGRAGVVIDPLRDETFVAEPTTGSWLNGDPISTTESTDLAGTVMATGFFYDHDRYAAEYTRPLTEVLARVNGVRRFGSAALDLAWTAAGRFDGYWELGVAPWDIAAGIMLVRAAGGVATDPFGATATPETRLVVAAGAGVHESLREVVAANLSDRLRGKA